MHIEYKRLFVTKIFICTTFKLTEGENYCAALSEYFKQVFNQEHKLLKPILISGFKFYLCATNFL
jgi:hypothetical protein